jgi:hypothetical protein
MGFNRRKLEDQRREAADKEAASRRATDAQVFEDAEHLIASWNERRASFYTVITVRSLSSTTGVASSPSTIVARTWASRSSAAALRTAS